MSFTPSQLQTLRTTTTVVSWTSLGLSLLLYATNMIIAKRRRFPSRISTYFAFTASLYHLNVTLGSINNYSHMQQRSLCLTQAFLFQYFACSLVWWYFLLYYNLHRVVRDATVTVFHLQRYERYYCLIGWGVPFIQALIPLFFDKLGPKPGMLYCWINDETGMWQFYCTYLPMLTLLIITLLCIVSMLRTLCTLNHEPKASKEPEYGEVTARSRTWGSHQTSYHGAPSETSGRIGQGHEPVMLSRRDESHYGDSMASGLSGSRAQLLPRPALKAMVRDYMGRHITFIFCNLLLFGIIVGYGFNDILIVRGYTQRTYFFTLIDAIAVCGIGIPPFFIFGVSASIYNAIGHPGRTLKLCMEPCGLVCVLLCCGCCHRKRRRPNGSEAPSPNSSVAAALAAVE